MTDSNNDTGPPESDTDAADADAPDAASENQTSADDHSLMEAAEAILFAADEPVSAGQIAEIVAEVTGRTDLTDEMVEQTISDLNDEYEAAGRAIAVHNWGGGYRMATRSSLSPFVKTLFIDEQETSLSRSLMETLAVIAYRQPVTRPEVDFIRGVNSDYAIRKLLEMGLVDVEGRADSLGRPLLYGTTSTFLEQFGLDTLDDLPTLREVEDLLDDPAFDDERAKLLQLDAEDEISVDPLAEETEAAEEEPEDSTAAD